MIPGVIGTGIRWAGRTNALLLYAFVVGVYLICAAGYIDTRDADPSIETAYALVERQSWQIDPPLFDVKYYFRNSRGEIYSKLGITMPLLYAPLVGLSKWLSPHLSFKEVHLTRFFISIINCFITAAAVTILFLFFRLREPPLTALALCLMAAFGTYLFPYSKTSHREPLQVLCLVGAYCGLGRVYFANASHWVFLSATLFASVGVLTKQAFLIPLFPVICFGMYIGVKRYSWRQMAFLFGVPSLITAFCWLLMNRHAFGGAFSTGYHINTMAFRGSTWGTPLLSGLYDQLLSPFSGFFFYNPILGFFSLVMLNKIWRRHVTPFDVCVMASFLLQACFYAKWEYPTGGPALGPRYLVVVAPLFFLITHPFPAFPRKSMAGIGLCILLFWSVLVQLVNVSIKPGQYWTVQALAGRALTVPHWAANFRFLWHKLSDRPEVYQIKDFGNTNWYVTLENSETLRGLNFWWSHLQRVPDTMKRVQNSPSQGPSVPHSL